MQSRDDFVCIGCAVKFGKSLGIIQKHVGITELYSRCSAFELCVKAAGIAYLHMFEQRETGNVVVIGRCTDQRGESVVRTFVWTQLLSGSGYCLGKTGVAQGRQQFIAPNFLRSLALCAHKGFAVSCQIVIDKRCGNSEAAAALVEVAVDIVADFIAVVLFVPQHFGVVSKIGCLEYDAIVIVRVAGVVYSPHAAVHHFLGGSRCLSQVVVDFCVGDSRVKEGVIFRFVIFFPSALK